MDAKHIDQDTYSIRYESVTRHMDNYVYDIIKSEKI